MRNRLNDPEWKRAMRWFYRYLSKYKWKEAVGLVLVTVCAVLNVINPKIMGIIVDDVIGDGKGIENRLGILPAAVALMIGCQVVRAVLRLISQWLFETCSQDMFTGAFFRRILHSITETGPET